jgi:hypothetical protein
MKPSSLQRAGAALITVVALLTLATVTSAHEERKVGGYLIEAGFLSEPTLEGEPNAALLEIVKTGTGGAAGKPVSGIADKLKVEITHVPSNTTKAMTLEESVEPGQYLAHFIPTAPGVYRFHFTGDINGMKLDETFTSGPNTFAEVESARSVQFPLQLGSSREIEAAVRGAQASIDNVQNSADTARRLAIVGMAVGAAGLALGALGVALVVRKR